MLEGVESYDISLEKQEVIVKGSIGYDDLLEKIKKTGKEVCLAMYMVFVDLYLWICAVNRSALAQLSSNFLWPMYCTMYDRDARIN